MTQLTMKPRRPLPTQGRLRELFDYDPAGFLLWRSEGKRKTGRIGKRAGSVTYQSGGYRRRLIAIDGVSFIAARLIWKWHTGEEPIVVDHINRESLDDRIENLRASDYRLNAHNRTGFCASGLKGAQRANGTYMAAIHVNGRRVYLGRHKTPEAAHAAYAAAASKLFGEHACLAHKQAAP